MLDVTFAGWAATVGLIAALFLLDLFVTRPGPRAHGRLPRGRRRLAVLCRRRDRLRVVFGMIAG
jgi:hypothetical protein